MPATVGIVEVEGFPPTMKSVAPVVPSLSEEMFLRWKFLLLLELMQLNELLLAKSYYLITLLLVLMQILRVFY